MNPYTASKSELNLPDAWRSKPWAMFAIGGAAVAASVVLFMTSGNGQVSGMKYFLHSYLTNFIFCLSISLGALFFVLMHFLTKAGWSASIRRIAELLATVIPWLSLLFIPIVWMVLISGNKSLFEWNGPVDSEIIAGKQVYLNGKFFTLRAIAYFVLWSIAANWYFRTSRKQDETGDVNLTVQMQKWSGPWVMVFALSVSFAAFDWIMSIDADWYSTVFGVYYFAACMLGFYSFMIVFSMILQNHGKMRDEIRVDNYHDMGKFMFGFIMFWSYIAFAQMMLYWYANLPEETEWFKIRLANGWDVLSYGLIPLHFAIPFLGVMSLHVRRSRPALFFWAWWVLIAHWLDMTFLILPNGAPATPSVIAGHLLCGIGMVCIFLAFFIYRASGVPLLAIRDPRLHEALSYSNPIL